MRTATFPFAYLFYLFRARKTSKEKFNFLSFVDVTELRQVAALVLRIIKAAVGMPEKRDRIDVSVRIRHTDAHSQIYPFVSLIENTALDLTQQFIDILLIQAVVRGKDREFLTAPARDGRGSVLAEEIREFLKDYVTLKMSVSIVDRLEMIDIKNEERNPLYILIAQSPLHQVVETAAVDGARQIIVIIEILVLDLGTLDLFVKSLTDRLQQERDKEEREIDKRESDPQRVAVVESEHVIAPRCPHEKDDDREHDRRHRDREPSPVEEQTARRQYADPYDTDAFRESRIDKERKKRNKFNAKQPGRQFDAPLTYSAERIVQRAKEREAQRHPEEHDVSGQIINQ